MIARAGHLALIVPDFARPPIRVADVGIHRYLGDGHWQTVPPGTRPCVLDVGC